MHSYVNEHMKLAKMAPKRCSKQARVVNSEESYKNLALSDALCPICRYILVLPITLPCNHNFCSECFEGITSAHLACPLCRIRFASWLRISKKEDKLVNTKLWHELQSQFGDKVQNRQNGIEENLEEVFEVKVSYGEIRKEYEQQRLQADLELRKEREAEEKASAELIEKMQAEDVLKNAMIEEAIRLDAKYAMKMARKGPLDMLIQNMNTIAVQKTSQPELPQTIHKAATSVAKEKSAKQKNLMNFNEVVEASDSNDSIEDECRYFKPIDHRNIPPSFAVAAVRIPAVLSKIPNSLIAPPGGFIQLEFSGDSMSAFARYGNSVSRKRKLAEHSRPVKMVRRIHGADKEMDCNHSERKLAHTMILRERKASTTISPTLPFICKLDNERNAADEARLRMEQEKADLEFAKKLQEQFNRERYKTRSSISCRNNMKKPRQLTITEIMPTSGKCK